MSNVLNVTRRSFLKTSTAVATFVLGSVVNPLSGFSFGPGQSEIDEIKAIQNVDPKVVMRSAEFRRVKTTVAERAFIIGLDHHLKKAGLKKHIDLIVTPIGYSAGAGAPNGYHFTGSIGVPGDRCTVNFDTNNKIESEFEYIKDISKRVSGGIITFFGMNYHERRAGQSGGGGRWA
jgi:hypothetical protein